MAEKKEIIVRALPREGRGKNDARRARREGKVPVIIYGGKGDSVAALAPLSELAAILRSDTGRNTIFTVWPSSHAMSSSISILALSTTNARLRSDAASAG